MLKKFFLFCLVAGFLVYSSCKYIDSGRLRDSIINHSSASWAPSALYYLGNIFLIIQKPERAEAVYKDVMEMFPETKYYEPAFYKYYYIASSRNRVRAAIERGKSYLNEFPESPKAERVKKRIHVLENY